MKDELWVPPPVGNIACRIQRMPFQTDSTGRPPHEVLADWLVENRRINPDWQLKSVQQVAYQLVPRKSGTALDHEYATYLIIWE